MDGRIFAGILCNTSPRTRHLTYFLWVVVIIPNFCFKEFRFGLHADFIVLVDIPLAISPAVSVLNVWPGFAKVSKISLKVFRLEFLLVALSSFSDSVKDSHKVNGFSFLFGTYQGSCSFVTALLVFELL